LRIFISGHLSQTPPIFIVAKNTTSFHLDRYFVELFGIKKRLFVIDRLINLEISTGTVGIDVEFVCLQFRKLLEQIAMLSLIAHVDEYSKIQSRFASQWNAKKILKEIEELNENYYPTPAKINEDERGKFIDPILKTDYLSKDDFLELYQICSSVIHAENPYVDEPKTPRPIEATFKKWYDKVYNLISFHVLVLFRMEYTFYGELFNDTGVPRVQLLEKIAD
jgi:hypothetical protein